MAVDWTDPCARAAALREAYFALISGQSEWLVRYRGPEGEREVRFQNTNIEVLRSELRDAETACEASGGPAAQRGRRYAIRGGARRGCL